MGAFPIHMLPGSSVPVPCPARLAMREVSCSSHTPAGGDLSRGMRMHVITSEVRAVSVQIPCDLYAVELMPAGIRESDLLRKYRIQIAGNRDLILKAFDLLLLFWS